MTIHILPPTPDQFLIDAAILEGLLHEAEPDLEKRPDSWTRATAAIVQPGIELMLAGFRQAWLIGPLARHAAVRVLTLLANGQEPPGKFQRRHLRTMVEGFRLANQTTTGAIVVRLFASNMLGAI